MTPKWEHEFLRLRIGKGVYAFRTLSWADAWEAQPFLGTIAREDAAGHPLAAAEALKGFLGIVCPKLLKPEQLADWADFREIHSNAIFEFYGRQSLEAMVELATRDRAADAKEADAQEQRKTDNTRYVVILAAAAKFSGVPLDRLPACRFEFVADCIRAMLAEAKEASQHIGTAYQKPGQIDSATFAGMMLGINGGEQRFVVKNPDGSESWMTALEKVMLDEAEKNGGQ